MSIYEKACYIQGRLQTIFPESKEAANLTAEEIIKKCDCDESIINFYVLAVIKECYCEKVC